MEPSVKIAADIAEHCHTRNGDNTTDAQVFGGKRYDQIFRHLCRTRSWDACVGIANGAALNLGEKGGCCTEN